MSGLTQRGRRIKKLRDRPPPPSSGAAATPSQPPPSPPPPPPPLEEEDVEESPYDLSGKKKTRGKSCGKHFHEILEANDGKQMPVIFDIKNQVPDDVAVAAFFNNEIGNIIRLSAPVCFLSWKKVDDDLKKKMCESLLVLFDVDMSHPKILEYVEKKFGKLYSVYKWRLHKHYLSCGTPEQGRATLPHKDLWNERPVSHWHWLCDYIYTAEDFIELSKINSINRKRQKYHHKGGARPFIQHAKSAHKKGAALSVIDNWETLHMDKNGQWINDLARENHDEMKNKRDEIREKMIQEAPEGTPADSIHVPLDAEFEIMAEKLGKKGRSIQGVGVFPRMESSSLSIASSMVSSSEFVVMQDQVKQLSENFIKLQKENEELRVQLKLQQENDNLRAQLAAVLARSQGQTSSNSRGSNGDNSEDEYYDELAYYNHHD